MALTLHNLPWNEPDKAFALAKDLQEKKQLTGEDMNQIIMSVVEQDEFIARLREAKIEPTDDSVADGREAP